jgi:hypothetical protein
MLVGTRSGRPAPENANAKLTSESTVLPRLYALFQEGIKLQVASTKQVPAR